MSTNFKELLEQAQTEEETKALNEMIRLAIALRQMNRIRESEDKARVKEDEISNILAAIDKENGFPKGKSRGRKGARNINR